MNEFVITINDKKHAVKLNGSGKIEINGKPVSAEVMRINNHAYLLRFGDKVFEITSNKIEKDRFGFLINGWYFDTLVRTRLQETANEFMQKKDKHAHVAEIKAPMPGLILKLKKQQGDEVKAGESLLILEAMKMENELHSSRTGKVKEVHVKEGTSVEKNTLIMTIE